MESNKLVWSTPLPKEEKLRLLKAKAAELAPSFGLDPSWISFGEGSGSNIYGAGTRPWINVDCEEALFPKVLEFLDELDVQLPGFLDWEEEDLDLEVPEGSCGSCGSCEGGKP